MFRISAAAGAFFALPFVLVSLGFSKTDGSLSQSAAASVMASQYNSQTVPLLTAANNINPSASVGGAEISIEDGSALVPQQNTGNGLGSSDEHGSSQISVYTVRDGDTLSGIAVMFDVSVNTIAWANGITGRTIYPGQELVILPITGIRHKVTSGETLASIATKYGGDVTEIAHFNELALSASLEPGATVIVPDGEISQSSPSNSSPRTGGPSLAGYYSWPLDGGVVTQGVHGYNAVDIGASSGTDIFAAAGGTVIIARGSGWNGGYGQYVVVQHSNGTQTLYAHMSKVLVSSGDPVGKGDPIGKVGSTGKSTGNHLHVEVRGAKNPFSR